MMCSDDYIVINSGNTIISGAAKDGIHTSDYFKMTGGNITTINNSADVKGIACDSTMTISGGSQKKNFTLSGKVIA